MPTTKALELIGRVLLVSLFLLAGANKIGQYDATAAYMSSQGVPPMLLPLVIALEIGGALAIIVGFMTRWAALALASFSVLAALLFHANIGDQMQFIMFFKNLGLAGGLLLLAANGSGAWSLDARRT